MYIWLPYADAQRSAKCLRTLELVQNEKNTRRILQELATGLGPFSRYPGVRMFAGSYAFLVGIGMAFSKRLDEEHNDQFAHTAFYAHAIQNINSATLNAPIWWASIRVHDSHKAYLAGKHAHYRKQWPDIAPHEHPVWPVRYPGRQRYEQAKRAMDSRA